MRNMRLCLSLCTAGRGRGHVARNCDGRWLRPPYFWKMFRNHIYECVVKFAYACTLRLGMMLWINRAPPSTRCAYVKVLLCICNTPWHDLNDSDDARCNKRNYIRINIKTSSENVTGILVRVVPRNASLLRNMWTLCAGCGHSVFSAICNTCGRCRWDTGKDNRTL